MNGYRNLYYDNKSSTMHMWSWDTQGNRQKYEMTFEPYLYVETDSTVDYDALSVYNTKLKKITFPNEFERRRFVERTRHRLFFNLQPEQQFLISVFKDTSIEDIVSNQLRVFMLDIEVYSPDEFPEAHEAKHPINIISVYDSADKKFRVWGASAFDKTKVSEVLAKKSQYVIDPNDIVYVHCLTEKQLLSEFLKFWERNYPDCVSGWNLDGFDIPYIVNRLNNVLGDMTANRLSPVRRLYAKHDAVNMFRNTVTKWTIRGVTTLDYMELYQSFSREKPDSMRLGDIATKELGVGKIDYIANDLAKLADTDWSTFVAYNIQDVNLLVLLDVKLRFIQLARFLAAKGFAPIQSALGKIVIISGALAVQGLKQNKIFSTAKTDPNNRGEYAGGYVMEPKVGFLRDVITYDANSLYPNTIITLNISQETKVGKIISRDDKGILFKSTRGTSHTLTHDQFEEFVTKHKIAISKADVLYTQAFKGIIPEFIEGFYQERVDVKKELFKINQQLAGMDKKDPARPALKQRAENLDMIQWSIKIFLNSIYGNFANPFSPLFDLDGASSITLTGQAVIKQAAIIGPQYTAVPGLSVETVYGDTDSANFRFITDDDGPVITKDGKVTDRGLEIAADLTTFLNKEINSWAISTLRTTDPRLIFKRENICDVAIYIAKKRYIFHIVNTEDGINTDKIKFVGVELARSSFSAQCKAITKRLVTDLIKTGDKVATNRNILDAFKEFKALPIDDIAFRTSLKDLEKYQQKADGFQVEKGTIQHAKGAILYNEMIKTLNLASKYQPITSGNKVKLVYISPNPYKIDVLCYNETFPVEFGLEIDYIRMFEKCVTPTIESIYETAGWNMPDMRYGDATDVFDFFS